MNPKTLDEIEKKFNFIFGCDDDWDNQLYTKMPQGWVVANDRVKEFIKQSNIALLERIEKEVVEQDATIYPYEGEKAIAWLKGRNELRASQRLKLDEIRKELS